MKYAKRQLRLANSGAFAKRFMAGFAKLVILLSVGCFGTLAQADMVYVVNGANNNVSVIDTNSNNVVATVPVGKQADKIAINPSGTRVYVTSNWGYDTGNTVNVSASSYISVIDTSSNSVVANVIVGVYPTGIAVNPSGTRVYVANTGAYGYGNINSISVIDTSTNNVIATVPVGDRPITLSC